MDKIREASGDVTTHLSAGFMATLAHEHPALMAIFILLIVILATYHIYNVAHKIVMKGCKNKQLCSLRRNT